MAAMLRGIAVTNHVLSPAAQRRFERLKTAQDARSATPQNETERLEPLRNSPPHYQSCVRSGSSRDIYQDLSKRAFVPSTPKHQDRDDENSLPVLIPPSRKLN